MRFDFQTFLPRTFDGKAFSLEMLLALEDEAGVEKFVVMPEPTVRPDNAGLAVRIRNAPRMVGCASINPTLGKRAVREFERAITDLGFLGLRLSPVAHGYPLDSETVYPLLEKAGELDVPVTTDSCSENCWPRQVAALAARFPGVTFLADVGFRPLAPPVSLNLAPPPAGRIADVARQYPNVYLGLTAQATVETYLIKRILGAVSVDRLVFGSNAPFGIPSFSIGGVQQARLGLDAETLFLGETLRKIYQLN